MNRNLENKVDPQTWKANLGLPKGKQRSVI